MGKSGCEHKNASSLYKLGNEKEEKHFSLKSLENGLAMLRLGFQPSRVKTGSLSFRTFKICVVFILCYTNNRKPTHQCSGWHVCPTIVLGIKLRRFQNLTSNEEALQDSSRKQFSRFPMIYSFFWLSTQAYKQNSGISKLGSHYCDFFYEEDLSLQKQSIFY